METARTSGADRGPQAAPRIAVLGAGGIGRHHANWWRVEGAEVVGILGRTPETVAASQARLKDLCGYDGPGFTDLDTLVQATRPEIVDICLPAALHVPPARQALEAGCHVLCEKPLLYDASLDDDAMRQQATDLVSAAREKGLRFGLCSQFFVAADTCRELTAARGAAPPRRIELELRSPARGRPPDPAQCWIDLGPHLVAALQALCPDARTIEPHPRVEVDGYNADLWFTLRNAPDHRETAVHLTVGFTTGTPANVRRITLDDTAFDLLGEAGPDGLFRMRYRSNDGIDVPRPDPMRLLIRGFLAGHPPLGASAALYNQEMLLRLLGFIRTAACS